MTKKYIVGFFVTLLLPVSFVFASTPILTVTGNADGKNVSVSITGADGNSAIALYYTSSVDGQLHSQQIGNTDGAGGFMGTIDSSTIDITATASVYTRINGSQSSTAPWPFSRNQTTSMLSFSKNNLTTAIGQSGSITVSGGTGVYYISTNSNSGVVSTSLSGNTLSFTGTANGSTVITICSGTTSTCGSVNLTTNSVSNSGFSVSPSTLTLGLGQSGTVLLSGGSAPYTISTMTGNSVAYAFVNNTLSITGAITGQRSVNVCSSNNACAVLVININTSQSNTLSLSPSSVNLNVGQTGTVQIMGGNSPYTVYVTNGNSVTSSVSGNTLTLIGNTSGATTLNVCSSNGMCSPLSVNTGGVYQNPSSIGFSLSLAISEHESFNLTGGSGSSYYLQSGMSSPVLAVISGNMLTVTGVNYGTGTVTVCQNGNTTCLPLTFVVNQSATPGTGGQFTFTKDLWFDLSGTDVEELQNFLIGNNYLSSEATGYFGSLTRDAVRRYQAANNISQTGYVGPLTREALNR
jgi:hypothetical protein